MTAIFADDMAIPAITRNSVLTSQRLQKGLTEVQKWLTKWCIKINETKLTHVIFTIRRDTYSSVILNGLQILQKEAKYLDLYLDRTLNWRKHIFAKRKQLGHQLRKIYWLIGRNSAIENKLLLYKLILKFICTYGIQLWGTTFNFNIDFIKVLIESSSYYHRRVLVCLK